MSIKNNDQEVIAAAHQWLQAGHTVQLVTVVRTWGSSPRPTGSLAAVRDDGLLVGSVSGGCVEKQLAEKILDSKGDQGVAVGNQVVTHHIDDEQARRFGLACGGELELVFEQFSNTDDLLELAEALQNRQSVYRITNLQTGVSELHQNQSDKTFEFSGHTLVKPFGGGWRMLIVGAGQLSRYTAEFAHALDYEVIVCEPRPGFSEAWTVDAAKVIDMSPDDAVLKYACDSRSAVLALTHDPNVDDLALLEALPSKAFYVGALGSKANNAKRKKRLAALGLEENEIERLVGPVGIDIGSRSSAEIAIAIAADLIQVRNALP